MATCLIALGSNIGDRKAKLEAALADIGLLEQTRLVQHSRYYPFAPVGGPAGQSEFLNAAAVVDTNLAPAELFEQLLQVESRHGRQRAERWTARTLDLDLLLYDEQVIDTGPLVVPHPRMSFRRFVLEPTAEIAPDMIHPTIGWSIRRLLQHLNSNNNRLAIVTHSDESRLDLSRAIINRYGAQVAEPPSFPTGSADSALWPTSMTAWISFAPIQDDGAIASGPRIAAETHPKLTILLNADLAVPSSPLRCPGRGPTLSLQTASQTAIDCEVTAALESVWPRLGQRDAASVQ